MELQHRIKVPSALKEMLQTFIHFVYIFKYLYIYNPDPNTRTLELPFPHVRYLTQSILNMPHVHYALLNLQSLSILYITAH